MAKQKIDKRTKAYKESIKNNPQGAGDIIENVLESTGVAKIAKKVLGEDCGCDERKEALNKLFPVRYKASRCFTDEELEWYDDYYKNRTLNLVTKEQLKEVLNIHEGVFKWKVNNLCHNCQGSAGIIKGMIERLDKVYLTYSEETINAAIQRQQELAVQKGYDALYFKKHREERVEGSVYPSLDKVEAVFRNGQWILTF